MHDGFFLLLLPPLSVGPVLAFLKADLLGPWGLPTKIRLTNFFRSVLKLAKVLDTPVEKFPFSLLLKPRCCLSTLSLSPHSPGINPLPFFYPCDLLLFPLFGSFPHRRMKKGEEGGSLNLWLWLYGRCSVQIRRERTKKKLSKGEKELGAGKKGQSSFLLRKRLHARTGGRVTIPETMIIDFPHFAPPPRLQ